MKHGLKKRILSLVLCISMVLPMIAQPMPVHSVESEESIAPLTNPFTPETIFTLPDGTTTSSQSYRIPSMVTLTDGTIVAAADIRWNTTFDGGGLDTLVARSTDGGANWSYTVANYLGDNGNQYNPQSTTFIDPNLLVAADGQTVYMLVDLYAYGVSLNGLWSEYSQPAADTGFDTNGNLKLSDDDHNNYNYYLKDGKIYDSSNNVVEGYEIDAYFNITYTTQNGEIKKSNLFFADSPFKVARTQYLYLTKSTDGGATWSEPDLLDVRAKAKVATTEKALLVSPGNSITTSSGIMVFPVYSYNGSAKSQQMAFIYSTDGGETWLRSDNFTGGATFSSEAAVVELENGNLRFFYRSDNKVLSYADFNLASGNWSAEVQTEVPANSDTQLSAITYSKTMDGKQVILISCPTGPNGEGSDDNNGSARINGKIHVFVMEEDGTMTLKNTVNMFETLATEKLPNANGDFFTEEQGFFSYSSMTERADGSIAILYENSQSGWGADEGYYFTITAKTFDKFELLYGNVSEELKVAYEKLMDTDLIADFEAEYETLSASDIAELKESVMWDDIAVHKCLLVYDHFYSTVSEAEFNAVKNKYPNEFAYIQADEELKYFNDQILERVKHLDQHPEDRYVQFGDVEFVELPSYTNVAPLVKPVVNTRLRSRATTGTFALTKNAVTAANDADNGVVLDKNVTKNDDGTYTVRLEAYTTGATVTTVTEKEMPADIILVLDLSSSMKNSSMDAVGYQQITGATALQGADFADAENLFVMVNGEYRDVTVKGSGLTTKTKEKQYSGKKTISDIQSYLNSGKKLYCKHDDGSYHEIKITEETGWWGNKEYIISCSETEHASVSHSSATINNLTLYESIAGVAYEKYEYSYEDENNQNVTITYNANDSIVGGSNPEYFRKVTSGRITRAEALLNAVTAFANQVAQKAKGKDGDIGTEDDVAHAIAIVGFCSNTSSKTGIYIGDTIYQYNDNGTNKASNVYGTALQDMSTATGVSNITGAIENLDNGSGTYTYCGTEMASGILAAQPADRYVKDGETIRSKVVVIFTDGEPNGGTGGMGGFPGGGQSGGQNDKHAYNSPIEDCYDIKNTYNATVYSVGILEGGDASYPATQSTSQMNRFMHAMSSNYKNATGVELDVMGDPTNDRYAVDGSNYYLLASNADDLNNIFGSISSSATSGGSITDLSTSTQIRDIISPYFQLPEGTDVSDIKLYYADYEGENKWSGDKALTGATPTIIDEKTIGVTGFDYKENWVGTATEGNTVTYHGKKLIIEFPIVVDPDFLGGSGAVTNGDTSGIYESATATTPIEKFEVPDVNVELREISTVVQDKHIYLGNTVDLTTLLNLYVKRDDQQEDLKITVDGINNAYVNLEYTITLDNNTVAVYTIPASKKWEDGTWTVHKGDLLRNYQALGDTKFEVTCVMTDAAESSKLTPDHYTANDTATIFVYKPTVIFKDSVQNYKQPLNNDAVYENVNVFLDTHKVGVVWKHETQTVKPEGDAPEISFVYTYADGAFNGFVMNSVRDVPVNVTATIHGTGGDFTDDSDKKYVTYEHPNCGSDVKCNYPIGDEEFIVHVINALTSLTIKKTGAADIDVNQSFLFTVTGKDADGKDINLTVTVHGNGSTTIDGLVIGNEYTITEKTDWSWRYKFSKWEHMVNADDATTTTGSTNGAAIKLGENGTITFTNTRNKVHWLDGDSWCNNIFKKKEGA